jgi:S1-C subfamily serine protease
MLNNVKAFKAGVVNLLCNGASGSGTRISADTVVTAFHVIDGATSCVVRSDGVQVAVGGQLSRSPSGRDVGYVRGLSFSREIPIVPMVREKKPLVGDMLVLLSYPQIFQNDLQTSLGFVTDDDAQSSLDTLGIEWRGAIVSDMSAGGGSSGGPVFNQDGEFVGIHVGGFSGAEDGGLELNFQLIFEQND